MEGGPSCQGSRVAVLFQHAHAGSSNQEDSDGAFKSHSASKTTVAPLSIFHLHSNLPSFSPPFPYTTFPHATFSPSFFRSTSSPSFASARPFGFVRMILARLSSQVGTTSRTTRSCNVNWCVLWMVIRVVYVVVLMDSANEPPACLVMRVVRKYVTLVEVSSPRLQSKVSPVLISLKRSDQHHNIEYRWKALH